MLHSDSTVPEISLCKKLFTDLQLSDAKIDEGNFPFVFSDSQMALKNAPTIKKDIPAIKCIPVLFNGLSYKGRFKSKDEIKVINCSSPTSNEFMRHHSGLSAVECDDKNENITNKIFNQSSLDTKESQLDSRNIFILNPNQTSKELCSMLNFSEDLESYFQECDSINTERDHEIKFAIRRRKQGSTCGAEDLGSATAEPMWYPCHKCHYEFSTPKGLANHIKTHPKLMIKKNTCVYCRKCLDGIEFLKVHLHAEHLFDIANYTCESCKVECISADLFDKHQYFCHRKPLATCHFCYNCDKVFYDEDILTYHYQQQKHCHICCITFCMSSEQYKQHKAKHILYKYKCKNCGASFITKGSLTKHIETKNMCHTKIKSKNTNQNKAEENEYIDYGSSEEADMPTGIEMIADKSKKIHCCPVCRTSYVRLRNLMSHIAAAHPKDMKTENFQQLPPVKSFQCSKCDKRFTKKSNLVAHAATHIRYSSGSKDDLPKCSICHKTFLLQRYLVDHMRLHTGRGTHQCQHCDKKFLRVSHLKLHMEMHENYMKSHTCTLCNRKYMRKLDLVHHMRVKHSYTAGKPGVKGEPVKFKGIPCPVCDVYFATNLKLRIHQISHSASHPPYKCQECGREFTALNTLKRHYLIHWDVRQYTCTICKKSFRYSQGLKRHMVTHTNEKPHVCPHCGKSFALLGTLAVHLQQHSQRTFPCTKCGIKFDRMKYLERHSCQQGLQDESSGLTDLQNITSNQPENVGNQIDSKKLDECMNKSQALNPTDTLGHLISYGVLEEVNSLTPLISEINTNNMSVIHDNISDPSVEHLISQVPGNIMHLNDPGQVSNVLSTDNDVSNSEEGIFDSSTDHVNPGIERALNLENIDSLSGNFGVVEGNSSPELPPGTIYTLVTVDGNDPQSTLISIPSFTYVGAEDNVTLQINFPDNGDSEVFIVQE